MRKILNSLLVVLSFSATILSGCTADISRKEITSSPAALVPEPAATQVIAIAPVGCTVISPKSAPGPTQPSIFPPVVSADWSLGPDEASITFVEYGDFQ